MHTLTDHVSPICAYFSVRVSFVCCVLRSVWGVDRVCFCSVLSALVWLPVAERAGWNAEQWNKIFFHLRSEETEVREIAMEHSVASASTITQLNACESDVQESNRGERKNSFDAISSCEQSCGVAIPSSSASSDHTLALPLSCAHARWRRYVHRSSLSAPALRYVSC